jgi:hypothetical protein
LFRLSLLSTLLLLVAVVVDMVQQVVVVQEVIELELTLPFRLRQM